MTIDWNQAPPWANYAAMDANGDWFWYSEEPSTRSDSWLPAPGGFEFFTPQATNWTQTLTQRPTT